MSEAPQKDINLYGLFTFVHLDRPRKIDPKSETEKAKYQLTLVFKPEQQKSDAFKAAKALANATAKEKWGDNIPKKLKSPFLTSDDLEDLPAGIEEGDVFIRLNSEMKPEVVDRRVRQLEAGAVYSGCWGNVNVDCYAWSHQTGGKGVSFGLGPVQKLEDGEPLGGSAKPAKSAFAALPDEDEDDDEGGII